jgi:prepilin-type N-terminal cleavage/methylation domain-containing protein
MKRKGFTLIELLAVIVILAVIAIMVTPMIVSTINSAKENAAKASALNYIDAVEQYAMAESAKGNTLESKTYNISELSDVGVNGKKPTSGVVTIANNIVTNFYLIDDGYEIKRTGSDGEVKVDIFVKLTGTPIGTIAQNLLNAAGTNTYTYLGGTYLKGAQTNNYVWFNGFVWRIMGKDADGNIRMITEENVTAIPWGAANSAQDYDNSYANSWVSSYFYNHIKNTNQIKIEPTTYCKNQTYDDASDNNGLNAKRIDCTGGTQANVRVAMLSLDEYNLSGGSSSYLVNGQYYWTLTPYYASGAWVVFGDGDADNTAGYDGVPGVYGLRPVITISSDAIITGGDGTLSPTSNGYILNQTLDNITNKKVSEVVTSGEYVTYDGRTYRVVEKNTDGVKLILDGFYTTDTAYGTDFNTMGSTLNDTNFQNWLLPTKTPQPVKWYRGAYFVDGNDYANNLSASNTSNEFQITSGNKSIGLIKVGEMMSGQSLSMLTTNYANLGDVVNRYIRTKVYWTLTLQSGSTAWLVSVNGTAGCDDVAGANGLRPVIVITSDATITGGNGTLTAPFEVN